MTNSMFCPACHHPLLHRALPRPEASRCSNPACLATYDGSGQPTTGDSGPWPDPDEVADLVAESIRGSIHDQDIGGSWYFQRGSTTYVE